MDTAPHAIGEREAKSLASILRDGRHRLHPETRALGIFPRPANRIGKPITQEEIAEAAGVSRQWYALLEAGAKGGVSSALIDRLANVLMLLESDRAALYAAGIPALAHVATGAQARATLRAFSWLRAGTKRLFSATTELEALTAATETVAERFAITSTILNVVRQTDGSWSYRLELGKPLFGGRFAQFSDEINATVGKAEMDDLQCYPELSQPGDLSTEEHLQSKTFDKLVLSLLAAYGVTNRSFLGGRIRSRNGFFASVIVSNPKCVYSTEERAAISTITELTSFAIR